MNGCLLLLCLLILFSNFRKGRIHYIHSVGRFFVQQKNPPFPSPPQIKYFPPFPSLLSIDPILLLRVLHCSLRIILCHSSYPGPKRISRLRSLTNCPTPSPSALYCSTTSFSTASSTVIIQPIIRLLLSSGCRTEENK